VSSAPDYRATGAAIAALFAGMAAPLAPAGLVAIRSSTATGPNQLAALPCVVVSPMDGSFRAGGGGRWEGSTWSVAFYLAERAIADLARDIDALEAWLTKLVQAVGVAHVQLGGLVDSCRIARWTVGGLEYAGLSYSGIALELELTNTEPWST